MQLYGVEVGEEMAPTGGSFAPLVDGYRQVHGMLQTFWPENTVSYSFNMYARIGIVVLAHGGMQPQVFGPCVGMGDEPPQAHTFWNGWCNRSRESSTVCDAVLPIDFINATVKTNITQVLVMHR
jgi:hypothetical protein